FAVQHCAPRPAWQSPPDALAISHIFQARRFAPQLPASRRGPNRQEFRMSDLSAKLEYQGKSIELAVSHGTVGPDVIDIATLYKNTGAFTYDPGFTSTASCESKITFIDGDEGILLHRGF